MLGVGGGMNADKAAAATNEALERRPLRWVEYGSGGVEENHSAIVAQAGIGELSGIL